MLVKKLIVRTVSVGRNGEDMKLLGKGQDPSFWVGLKEKKEFERYINELWQYWNEKGETLEFKALPYSKWKLFWSSGNRGLYEDDYFERRYFVEHALPLALIYPEDERFVEKLSDAIFAICDEYTWCLPAHQGQNEKNNNSVVDLFASETAFYLALVDTLLGDRLDSVIRDRIRVEVKRRVFDSFLGCETYGWWEKGSTNWTAVCTGSVGCAMMLLAPELVDEGMQARLVKAMNGFLDGFADDGICTEGCGYWAYGVSFFVQFADMIKTFTDGRIDFFKEKKVRAIATFPQKMFLSGKASVSFSDGPRELEYTFGVMHRLKSEYPEDVLIYSPEYGSYDIGCGRVCIRLFGAIWHNDEYYNNPADSTACFEEYAANTCWLTKRTVKYGFAAKAGHNAEMHNHNDVGSFIFAKGGRQLIVDTGAGVYTRQYFSKERYDIFEPSSRSHCLPIIGGEYQLVGKEHAACDVVYKEGHFSMDIAGAYPDGVAKSVKRSFDMDDDKVTLTDVFDVEGGRTVVERFVSYVEPVAACDGVLNFGECKFSYFGDAVMSVSTEETHDGTCYIVDFTLNEGEKEFKVVME